MITALVDGDLILYRTAFSCTVDVEWEEGIVSRTLDLDEAMDSFKQVLYDIQGAISPDHLVLCFSDTKNFRKGLWANYKANRKETPKPVGFNQFKERLLNNPAINHLIVPTLEADDVMGIMATSPNVKGEKFIVSLDKDMKTVPGKHLHLGTFETFEVSEPEADFFFYTQVLTGDSSDGYRGCPGVGPVKAAKILGDGSHAWKKIVAAYGGDEPYALLMARMARILRHSDYDFNKKEPILWRPSST